MSEVQNFLSIYHNSLLQGKRLSYWRNSIVKRKGIYFKINTLDNQNVVHVRCLSLKKYILYTFLSKRICLFLSVTYSSVDKLHKSEQFVFTHTERSIYLVSQAYCFTENNMSIMVVTTEIQYWTQQAESNVVSVTELQKTLGGTLQQQHTFTNVFAARVMLNCWRPRCLQWNWLSFKWFLQNIIVWFQIRMERRRGMYPFFLLQLCEPEEL